MVRFDVRRCRFGVLLEARLWVEVDLLCASRPMILSTVTLILEFGQHEKMIDTFILIHSYVHQSSPSGYRNL